MVIARGRAEERLAAKRETPRPRAPLKANRPLLYIDDCEDDRLLVGLAISLTKTPFEFHQAECIESATAYFGQGNGALPLPALVLLDYDLGRHTGADFLYWLRKQMTSIPVVMFSGSAGTANVAKCYEAGANHFITKPKELERLKAVVRALYLSIVSDNSDPTHILRLPEYQTDPRKKTGLASPRQAFNSLG